MTTPQDITPLPWSSVANSWQHTTIYDDNDRQICRLDLEDWGVTEDNQDELEKKQAAVVAYIVEAANNYPAMKAALNDIAWMDEHLTAETAREMMNLARTALGLGER